MSYLSDAADAVLRFEGSVPFMYRDTSAAGWVTVGVGRMLPNLAAAVALPFMASDGQRPATAEEVTMCYDRVAAMPLGLIAGAYDFPGSVVLADREIRQLLETTLGLLEAHWLALWRRFQGCPDAVKVALLDMSYNLGMVGVLHGYPRMMGCLSAGDWMGAAQECHRQGVSDARNNWTAQQFTRERCGAQ